MKIVGIPIEDIQAFLDEYTDTIMKIVFVIVLLLLLVYFFKEVFSDYKESSLGKKRTARSRLSRAIKVTWVSNKWLRIVSVIMLIEFVWLFGTFTTTAKIDEAEYDSNLDVMVFTKEEDDKYYFHHIKQYNPITKESNSADPSTIRVALYYGYSDLVHGFELDDNHVYLDDEQRFEIVQNEKSSLKQLCYVYYECNEVDEYYEGYWSTESCDKENKKKDCLELNPSKNTIELSYKEKRYRTINTKNYLFGILQFEEDPSEDSVSEYEIYLPSDQSVLEIGKE